MALKCTVGKRFSLYLEDEISRIENMTIFTA